MYENEYYCAECGRRFDYPRVCREYSDGQIDNEYDGCPYCQSDNFDIIPQCDNCHEQLDRKGAVIELDGKQYTLCENCYFEIKV